MFQKLNPYRLSDTIDRDSAPEVPALAHRIRSTILPLFLLLLVPAALLYLPIRSAVSPALLSKVRTGMTKIQVKSILGAPDYVHNPYQWDYARLGNVGYVSIGFDSNELVSYVNDESVFPALP